MNVLRWSGLACLIVILFAGQAFAQGSNQQITLEVPVQLNNMHEEAVKVKVSCTIFGPASPGENLGESLGMSYNDVQIPSDGSLNTTVTVVIHASEGKDFGDAAIYRASIQIGFVNPTLDNPNRIMYHQPSYDSQFNAPKAKEGTTLVYLVEGSID